MKTRLAPALALLLASAGSLSCEHGPSRFLSAIPVPTERIELTLAVSPPSGSAGHPVTITATVRNRGGKSVILANMCPVPMIRILDQTNAELFQLDPTRGIACPAYVGRPLDPGAS